MRSIDLEQLEKYSEDELAEYQQILNLEIKERMTKKAIGKSIKEEFTEFKLGTLPYLQDGLLYCPGVKINKGLSHKCSFISINDKWSWESDLKIEDAMEFSASNSKILHTLTTVAPIEGLKVDLIVCNANSGIHKLKFVKNFIIESGNLVSVKDNHIRELNHNSRN